MILLTVPIRLYGQNVIVDLVSRSSAPGPKNFPFFGMESLYNKWSGNVQNDIEVSAEYIFANCEDFDADHVQPVQVSDVEFDENSYDLEEKGEYVPQYSTMTDDPHTFNKYLRRLEDINVVYLERYLGNIVFRMCYQSGSTKSIAAIKAKHTVQPTLVDDDDDVTELADIQLEEIHDDWSDKDRQNALRELPYVLKRLHTLSIYMGVHILSYISAYTKAKDRNFRMRTSGSQKTLTSNDVILQGVYLADKYGNAVKQVEVKNKNKKAVQAFEWITKRTPVYSAYLQDYYDYMHYCDVLNIDILNDDMSKYGFVFAQGLVVTTVTRNSQFNNQIFESLRLNSTTVPEEPDSSLDIVENTMSLVLEAFERESNSLFYNAAQGNLTVPISSLRADGIKLFVNVMTHGEKNPPDLLNCKLEWIDGYLYYDGKLVILDTKYTHPTSYVIHSFIISEIGVAIMLSDKDIFNYLPCAMALSNFSNYYLQHITDKRTISDWVCFR